MKSNTIAVLLHFNEGYENLLDYSVRLASDLNKKLILGYAYYPTSVPLLTPGAIGSTPDYQSDTSKSINIEIKNKINSLVERAQEDFPEIEISYNVTEGFDKNIINELADREDVELIITDYEHGNIFTSPTQTEEIIEVSQRPVLIISSDIVYKPVERVVYATDYNEEDIPTIKKILEVFGGYNPLVTALHITNNTSFEERILKEGFTKIVRDTGYSNINIKILSNKTDADSTEIIRGYASLIDADMIVVLKKNKTFIEKIFKTSITKKLIGQSHIPVLVFQER